MNICPLPIPPHHRPIRHVSRHIITGSGTADVTKRITLLDCITIAQSGLPYSVTMPPGTRRFQRHELMIPSANANDSAAFVVTGPFVGFNGLLLDKQAMMVAVEWDGHAWTAVGGTATDESEYIPEVPPGDVTDPDKPGFRVKGGKFQLLCPDDNKWYDVVPHLTQGAVSLSLDGPGEANT